MLRCLYTAATGMEAQQTRMDVISNNLANASTTGFIRLQQASGDSAYTRAGNFPVDSTGRIVTQGGDVVDPGITVPPDATGLTVAADGTVTATLAGKTEPQQLGQIQIFTFTNPAGLTAVGGNLLAPSAA